MKFDQFTCGLGQVLVSMNKDGLSELRIGERASPEPHWSKDPQALAPALRQLREYLAGKRRLFKLPLAPKGTDFQRKVWEALVQIPYGQTWSYGQLARFIGNPKASRAVGGANGRNPLPIIIPCHRVIASGGRLGGYALGPEIKRQLLCLEGLSPPSA